MKRCSKCGETDASKFYAGDYYCKACRRALVYSCRKRSNETHSEPVLIGWHRDLKGRCWSYYQHADGQVIGPCGPFPG